MTRIGVLLLALVFSSAKGVPAQAPKPDREVEKLRAELGHWTFEVEAKTGPGCLDGKFTGEMACQAILGDSFLQCWLTEKEQDGEFRFFVIEGYDPVNKNFTRDGYAEDGSKSSSVLTIQKNEWTYTGRWIADGKQYRYKGTFIFAPDFASGTFTDAISLDGEKWSTEESKYQGQPRRQQVAGSFVVS